MPNVNNSIQLFAKVLKFILNLKVLFFYFNVVLPMIYEYPKSKVGINSD